MGVLGSHQCIAPWGRVHHSESISSSILSENTQDATDYFPVKNIHLLASAILYCTLTHNAVSTSYVYT